MESSARRPLTRRMADAARVRIALYEEVEHDLDATGQAAAVVGLVAVASAIGGVNEGAVGIVGGLVGAYVGWLLWAAVAYIIGDKVLGGTATWGELLRTLGFAQSPGVLFVLGFIPLIGWIVVPVAGIWMLVTAFIALRQALDVSNGRTILTVILGAVPYGILRLIVLGILGV